MTWMAVSFVFEVAGYFRILRFHWVISKMRIGSIQIFLKVCPTITVIIPPREELAPTMPRLPRIGHPVSVVIRRTIDGSRRNSPVGRRRVFDDTTIR